MNRSMNIMLQLLEQVQAETQKKNEMNGLEIETERYDVSFGEFVTVLWQLEHSDRVKSGGEIFSID